MSFEVIYDDAALEFLSKLEHDIRKRIYDKIKDTKENPRHYFKPLAGRDDYRLRVGDYRVIADINDSANRIEITYIEHRKKVYKKI